MKSTAGVYVCVCVCVCVCVYPLQPGQQTIPPSHHKHTLTYMCALSLPVYNTHTHTFTFTFSHLADAFVQSDVQWRELVDANWKAVLSTEHISHLTQNPRSYRDLNSDRS